MLGLSHSSVVPLGTAIVMSGIILVMVMAVRVMAILDKGTMKVGVILVVRSVLAQVWMVCILLVTLSTAVMASTMCAVLQQATQGPYVSPSLGPRHPYHLL